MDFFDSVMTPSMKRLLHTLSQGDFLAETAELTRVWEEHQIKEVREPRHTPKATNEAQVQGKDLTKYQIDFLIKKIRGT